MLVETPPTWNSLSARSARVTADSKSRPRQVSLDSSESKCALTTAPVKVVPPSRRTPGPPGDRYDVMVPVSGRNSLAGSSVVMRHCSAKPRAWMSSCTSRSRSASVAPAAIWICACTRSTPVTSSVTVCSTWMRGFISMKTYRPSAPSRNSTVPAHE